MKRPACARAAWLTILAAAWLLPSAAAWASDPAAGIPAASAPTLAAPAPAAPASSPGPSEASPKAPAAPPLLPPAADSGKPPLSLRPATDSGSGLRIPAIVPDSGKPVLLLRPAADSSAIPATAAPAKADSGLKAAMLQPTAPALPALPAATVRLLAIKRAALGNKYLDCHVHTAGLGDKGSGCFVSKPLRESYKFPIYLRAFGVSERELMDQGDSLVPDRISSRLAESRTVGAAVLLALDGVADAAGGLDSERTQIYIPNAFVAAEARKHANIYFGASVNPKRRDALEKLRRAKAEGALLVKWIPSIMDIDPADSANIPFYRTLKELGLPLLTHTGTESSFLEAKDSLCDPFRLELPLTLGVTVIAAHVGTPGQSQGQDNMERAMIMMGRFSNLYADISSLTQINKLRYLKRILIRKEVKGRLIYGTDFPLIETALVSPYYYIWRAPFNRLRAAAGETNPWDRDVALKKALGVGGDIFTRSEKLLLGPK